MDGEWLVSKLEDQEKAVEMMQNSSQYSEANEYNFPYANLLYPSGTKMPPPPGPVPRPWPRVSHASFPEEWVPKGIEVVRAPVFRFFVLPKPMPLDLGAKIDPDLKVESRVGKVFERKLFARSFRYDRPLREEDEEFEWQVREALSSLLKQKFMDEEVMGRKILMFLFRLSERRTETYGYLPNRATITAGICKFTEER